MQEAGCADRIPGLVTQSQAAELRGVARQTVIKWTQRGQLTPVYRVGQILLYREEDVRAVHAGATAGYKRAKRGEAAN